MTTSLASLLCSLVFMNAVLMVFSYSDFSTIQLRRSGAGLVRRRCSYNKYQCRNGDCIPGNRLCDGFPDCRDGSDEDNNTNDLSTNQNICVCTSGDRFQCLDNRCMDRSARCNGHYDCFNGEDELHCDCPSNKFQCAVDGNCIDNSDVCDNWPDCGDRSDESESRCEELGLSRSESQRSKINEEIAGLQALIQELKKIKLAREESKPRAELMQSLFGQRTSSNRYLGSEAENVDKNTRQDTRKE